MGKLEGYARMVEQAPLHVRRDRKDWIYAHLVASAISIRVIRRVLAVPAVQLLLRVRNRTRASRMYTRSQVVGSESSG
jgi:hypothetical protein